jgi:hypothetical protein
VVRGLERRFQNPTELLKAMPTITGAVDTRSKITSSKPAEDTFHRFACRNSQAAARLAPDKISLALVGLVGGFLLSQRLAYLEGEEELRAIV